MKSKCLVLGLFLATACGSGETDSTGSGGSASTGTTGTGDQGENRTLTLDSFTVEPGEEVYKCQNFANPFGADRDVAAFASQMTPGSHHMLLFYKDDITADSPLEDCSGFEFDATPYGSQLPDDRLDFPPGIAARLPGDSALRIQSHYLNTTSEPIRAHVEVTLHMAKPGTVKQHAGVLFVIEGNIAVMPHDTAVVKHDCTIPFDMNVIKATSHMHRHGTHFKATVAGENIYETETWNDPQPALFDPPRALKGGDPLSFACTFVNDSGDTLSFGESAQSDEMCIFGAQFYPLEVGAFVGCD